MVEALTDEEIVALRVMHSRNIAWFVDPVVRDKIIATLAAVPDMRAARARAVLAGAEVEAAKAKVAEEERLVGKVLEALREGGPTRTAPIVRLLGISEGRALRLLSRLQRDELIVSRPASRPGPGSHQALVWALADGSKP